MLIKYGADVTVPTKNGWTAAHSAVLSGHEKIIQTLAENNSNIINKKNSDGFTALHLATGLGRTQIVKFLVQNGADVRAQANAGHTPIYLAIQSGKLESGRIYLSGISKRFFSFRLRISFLGHDDIVKFLENHEKTQIWNE